MTDAQYVSADDGHRQHRPGRSSDRHRWLARWTRQRLPGAELAATARGRDRAGCVRRPAAAHRWDGLSGSASRSSRPFMVDIYRNAQATGSLPLLWLAIVIAAPVAEEIIFRGFIFRGWVRSAAIRDRRHPHRRRVFAVIHIQYNWFGVFQVFLIGLTADLGPLAQRLDAAADGPARPRQFLCDDAGGPVYRLDVLTEHDPEQWEPVFGKIVLKQN